MGCWLSLSGDISITSSVIVSPLFRSVVCGDNGGAEAAAAAWTGTFWLLCDWFVLLQLLLFDGGDDGWRPFRSYFKI